MNISCGENEGVSDVGDHVASFQISNTSIEKGM